MIFLKQCFAYSKLTQGEIYEYQEKALVWMYYFYLSIIIKIF